MPKSLVRVELRKRGARSELPQGRHWDIINDDVHLGYRKKGDRYGVWFVRWRVGIGYRQMTLGAADDAISEGTLDYKAAVKLACETVERERADAKAKLAGPLVTVQAAVNDYIAMRDLRDSDWYGRKVRSDASCRLGRYVLGVETRGKVLGHPRAKIADMPLHRITEPDLEQWRTELPAHFKRGTLDRLCGDLKAALTNAYAANRAQFDPRLPEIIKEGLRLPKAKAARATPIARDNQILSDGDIARLLNAARQVDAEQKWDGDLFRLVLVLTATGARFSQVVRMRVADCQIGARRLIVPVSRKGRGVKAVSEIAVPVGDDILDELVSATHGREPDALLLERWRHAQAPGGEWHRTERGAWQMSSEMIPPWRLVREKAGLPKAIPYALRHTSIVRGIRANLPVRLVAAMHDTSISMIEKHYTAWIVSGLEEMARTAIVPLVPLESGARVVKLREGA